MSEFQGQIWDFRNEGLCPGTASRLATPLCWDDIICPRNYPGEMKDIFSASKQSPDTSSQTFCPSCPGGGGHFAVLWCGHRQLRQRAAAQALRGWWTRRRGLHRSVWNPFLLLWPSRDLMCNKCPLHRVEFQNGPCHLVGVLSCWREKMCLMADLWACS